MGFIRWKKGAEEHVIIRKKYGVFKYDSIIKSKAASAVKSPQPGGGRFGLAQGG